MASRLTGLLIDNGDGKGLVHIGGGYSYLDPSNDLIRYRNQPEVFVGEEGGGAFVPVGVPSIVPPFVDTGLINTRNVNLFNAEWAVAYGSMYAQSEFVHSKVDQLGGPGLDYSGAYVYAGYFLTGESRTYNHKNGVFGRVKPRCNVGKNGGIGAWEIAGRWSYINLDDAKTPTGLLDNPGRLDDLTAGLNWYLNPYTKFQWNYIHSLLDNRALGDSTADIYAMRAQVDF